MRGEGNVGGDLEELLIREAREDDIPAIVALYAADALGGHDDTTEEGALSDYMRAFRRIAKSPNDSLYVAEIDGDVVGVFQTTLITQITGRGSTNLTIEAIQTRSDMRGKGIGTAMIEFAVDRGREAGVRMIQLTSNRVRTDAHRFYERLGFVESHAGFKMKLG
jgi:GNAT superfamily N-acetyltransferase